MDLFNLITILSPGQWWTGYTWDISEKCLSPAAIHGKSRVLLEAGRAHARPEDGWRLIA